jgi:hypothetical protein
VGSNIDGVTLAIRDPQGDWVHKPLSSVDLRDGSIELGSVSGINWVTGQYRVELVGPMGTGGMSEAFVVIFDGRLEMEDRLFSPSEVVTVGFIYRESAHGDEVSISMVFSQSEYRKSERLADSSILLSLTIPRISFDVGGVDMPPDFQSPSHKTFALEDLERPRGRRLFVRTGRQSELLVTARDSDNALVHKELITTSGPNASGAIDIDQILESIRLRGADKTVVELCLNEDVRIPMLTIQQVLDFRIKECDYQFTEDGSTGQTMVQVSTQTESLNVRVLVRSLERVWEEPVVGVLRARNEETGDHVAVCGPIPPGLYSVELAVGTNTRPVPSTSRIRNFGTREERAKYLASIAGDSARLAERIVAGESISRAELSRCSHDDFLRVVRFFVLRHRDFPTNSPQFVSSLKCIASEGSSRKICEWMTHMGAEVATTRDLEIFVVRLFSIFVDAPLEASIDRGVDGDDEDAILAARLWAVSPLIGMTFTHRMPLDAVGRHIADLGSPGAEPKYENLAELTWPDLDEQITRADETSAIFSRGYAVLHFMKLWKQCWPKKGPDPMVMEQLMSWVARGKELAESTFAERSYEFPQAIASTAPSPFRQGRKPENLAIAKFVHNLFRLAWLAARPETPLEIALQACEVLGESYGLSKGLTDRALILAIVAERTGEFGNV